MTTYKSLMKQKKSMHGRKVSMVSSQLQAYKKRQLDRPPSNMSTAHIPDRYLQIQSTSGDKSWSFTSKEISLED